MNSNGVRTEFLTGPAGSGKTFTIRKRIEDNPGSVLLCATTGVAAVNLDTVTINSVLGYYDTSSLIDKYVRGYLHQRLRKLSKAHAQPLDLVIDEVSMMHAEQLDTIYKAIAEVNYGTEAEEPLVRPLGIGLTGDFCFGEGTPVMRADGSIVPVERIRAGDAVMGPDSQPRNVLQTTRGEDSMYLVRQSNGDSYVVNSHHLIALKRGQDGRRKEEWGIRYPHLSDYVTMTAPELMERSRKFRETFVGYKAGIVSLPDRPYFVDPYFLGLWLGDGDSDAPRITTMDSEVSAFLYEYAKRVGLQIKETAWERTPAKRLHLTSGKDVGSRSASNPIWEEMKSLELPGFKHIPEEYSQNSEAVRLALLAGLIDSDGCWHGNRYTITLTNKTLAHQTKYLADGLGFRAAIRGLTNGYYQYGSNGGAWTVAIGGDTWRIPCRVARKKSSVRELGRSRLTSVLRVEPVGYGPYFGFETDGDHLFLLGDTTVAHNCQLPPVKGRWAFQADAWPEFAAHTNRLTKIWRQSDPAFLDAINAARRGDGPAAAAGLRSLGAHFSIATDLDFDGTTIVAKNDEADRFNAQRLLKINTPPFALQTKRDGVQSSDWKNIPDRIILKPGCLVMLLANKKDSFNGGFQYVNGDLAHVVEHNDFAPMTNWQGETYEAEAVQVTSVRTGETFWVERVVRENKVRDEPGPSDPPALHIAEDGQYVIGIVDWFPMRLGYCSTVHKSQGLSLDRVQLDCRDGFFGAPSMAYVALSRARTVEGMRIVGGAELLARRIKFNPEVAGWL